MSHLQKAQEAIDYVRSTCEVLAQNREADRIAWSKDRGETADMDRLKNTVLNSQVASMLSDRGWSTANQIEATRIVTGKLGVGNCDEMARTAFAWLAEQGVRPLELLYVSGSAKTVTPIVGETADVEPDHSIVILGRTRTAEELREPDVISLPHHSKWNAEAVVCDPWARRCYTKDRWETESHLIRTVTAGNVALSCEFRLDTGEEWTPFS